jgi:hypothetical protein
LDFALEVILIRRRVSRTFTGLHSYGIVYYVKEKWSVFQGEIVLLVEIFGRNLIIEEVTWSLCNECDDCTFIFYLHIGISRTKFLKEGRL